MADNKKISELTEHVGMPDDAWHLVLAKENEDNYKITFKNLAEHASSRGGAVLLVGNQNIAGEKDFDNLKFGGKIVGTQEKENEIVLFANQVSGNLDLLSGYVHTDLKNYIDSRDDAVSGYVVGYSDEANRVLSGYVDNVSGLIVQLDGKTTLTDQALSGYIDAVSGDLKTVSGEIEGVVQAMSALAQSNALEHQAIYTKFEADDNLVSGYAKALSGNLQDDIDAFGQTIGDDFQAVYNHIKDTSGFLSGRDELISGYLTGFAVAKDLELSGFLKQYVDENTEWDEDLSGYVDLRDNAISGYSDAQNQLLSGHLTGFVVEKDLALSGYVDQRDNAISGYVDARELSIRSYVDIQDETISGYLTGFAVAKDLELSGILKQYVDDNTEWDKDLSGYVDLRDNAISGYSDTQNQLLSGYLTGFATTKDLALSGYVDLRDDVISGYVDTRESIIKSYIDTQDETISGYLTGFAVAKDIELSGILKQYVDENTEWDKDLSGYVDLRDDAISGYLTGFAVAKDLDLSGYLTGYIDDQIKDIDLTSKAVLLETDQLISGVKSFKDGLVVTDMKISGDISGVDGSMVITDGSDPDLVSAPDKSLTFDFDGDVYVTGSNLYVEGDVIGNNIINKNQLDLLSGYVNVKDAAISGYSDSRNELLSGYLTGYISDKNLTLSGYVDARDNAISGYVDDQIGGIDLTDTVVLLETDQLVSGVKTFKDGIIVSDIKLLGDMSGVGGSTVMTDGSDPESIDAPDKSLAFSYENGVYITGATSNLYIEGDIIGGNLATQTKLDTLSGYVNTQDNKVSGYLTGFAVAKDIELSGALKQYVDLRDNEISGYSDTQNELLSGYLTGFAVGKDLLLSGYVDEQIGGIDLTDTAVLLETDQLVSGVKSFKDGITVTDIEISGDINGVDGSMVITDGSDPDLITAPDKSLALDFEGGVYITGSNLTVDGILKVPTLETDSILSLEDIEGEDGSMVITDGSDPDLIVSPDKSLAFDFEGGVYVTGSNLTVDGALKTTTLETHSILGLEDIEGEAGAMVLTDGSDPDSVDAPDKSLTMAFDGGVYITGSDLSVEGTIHSESVIADNIESSGDIVMKSSSDDGEIDGSIILTDGQDPKTIGIPDNTLNFYFASGVFIGPTRILPDGFTEVSDPTYEILLTDRVIGVDTTAPNIVADEGCLITMPEASTLNPGQMFSIKDIGGSGATYPITVSGHIGQMIDGTNILAVDNDYALAQLFTDKQNWYIM